MIFGGFFQEYENYLPFDSITCLSGDKIQKTLLTIRDLPYLNYLTEVFKPLFI